jgi:hypothetical protein
MHSGTERRVHLEVTWFSVCRAFDFRYATELVIVIHQLFVLASTRREAPKSRRAFHEGEQRFASIIVRPQAKRRQCDFSTGDKIRPERCP